MAMTPEEKNRFEKLEQLVQSLLRAENVSFIESIKRRLDIDVKIANIRLNDLVDVDTTGVSNGQVIKYTSSTALWENANDIDT